MEEYFPILLQSTLFCGVQESELSAMLACLGAREKAYQKGETLFHEGDAVRDIAVLISGVLHLQKDDYWGRRSLVQIVTAGELFGEAYAALENGVLPHDIVAAEDVVVMYFDVRRVLTVCPSACKFHAGVVQNLFRVLAEKNRRLVQKLGHMANRTTREKLLSYLSEESKRQKSDTFEIPFSRQQLADFLAVDRSAMSAELGRLRDEGVLTTNRRRFTLHRA